MIQLSISGQQQQYVKSQSEELILCLENLTKRKFDVTLRKVGNSYVVTIPKDTVDRFDLEEGDYPSWD